VKVACTSCARNAVELDRALVRAVELDRALVIGKKANVGSEYDFDST